MNYQTFLILLSVACSYQFDLDGSDNRPGLKKPLKRLKGLRKALKEECNGLPLATKEVYTWGQYKLVIPGVSLIDTLSVYVQDLLLQVNVDDKLNVVRLLPASADVSQGYYYRILSELVVVVPLKPSLDIDCNDMADSPKAVPLLEVSGDEMNDEETKEETEEVTTEEIKEVTVQQPMEKNREIV